MSYLRDPDRKLRGVGSIASRDAVRRPARFASRRALGAETASESTACAYYDNGAWYIRRDNGRVDKVSEAEAKTVPQCSTAVPISGGAVSLTPTRTGPSPAKFLSPVGRRKDPGYRQPARTGTILGVQETMTPAQTAGGSTGGSFGGKTGTRSTSTSDGASRKPSTSSTGTKTVTTKTGGAPSSSDRTSSGGGGGGGGTTAGVLTTSPSVSTQWVAPTPVPDDIEISVPPSAPSSSSASVTVSGKHLFYLGAGIGLLYLLTRDTRD